MTYDEMKEDKIESDLNDWEDTETYRDPYTSSRGYDFCRGV